MSDYSLSNLSTRSFERLVQALAVAVFGPQIQVFGDGRDGGREATFDGETNYTGDSGVWSGYGVVQSKFKQRPGEPEKDVTWALKELEKELRLYRNDNQRRIRTPEYYVYAVNVVLTPVLQVGGKDRVTARLAEWAGEKQVKEVLLWDYDQICTLLDCYESIRRTYSAWITPGDVLSELVSSISTRPDYSESAASYLQKEMWRDQFAQLEQAGHPQDERVPLANVFVDLPVSDASSADELEAEGEEFAEHEPFVKSLVEAADVPLAVDNFVERPTPPHASRWVLIGGPGQGKTTVGQFACQIYRARLLDDSSAALSPEIQEIYSYIKRSAVALGIWPSARRFPIRIVLSEYAKRVAEADVSVYSYLAEQFHKRTNYEVDASFLREFFLRYASIFVFDGLDEVPASANREAVLSAIRDFQVDVANGGWDCFVLVTTRPQGYNHDLAARFYRHRLLVRLDQRRALEYGDKLTSVRFGSDSDRVEKVSGRLRIAAGNDSTVRLMSSPLQVTIMVLLVDQQGHPPEERWELFNQYYELICRREVERDLPTSKVIREHRPHIDGIHRMVGLFLQALTERTGRSNARLSLLEFRSIVEQRLAEEEFSRERLTTIAQQIEDAAGNRLVFLAGLEEGEVGFEIRSLQEFMAGEALVEGSDAAIEKRLRAISPSPNWRNVFLFATGKCFSKKTHLRPLITDICSSLNEDPYDAPSVELMAGSLLALDLLSEGTPRQSPKFSRQLMRFATRLLDRDRPGSGKNIADTCDIDTLDVLLDELDVRLAHAEPSKRQESVLCFARLADRGLVSLSHFVGSVWSRTNTVDPRLFWALFSTLDRSEEMMSLLADILPRYRATGLVIRPWEEHQAYGALLARNDLWPRSTNDALRLLSGEAPKLYVRDIHAEGNYVVQSVFGTRDLSIGEDVLPPDVHGEYVLLSALVRFHAEPSLDALAKLVETYPDSGDLDEMFESDVPVNSWLTSSVLGILREGVESKASLVERVRAGEWGDANLWGELETKWAEHGIVLSDALHAVVECDKVRLTESFFPFWSDLGYSGRRPRLRIAAVEEELAVARTIGQPFLRKSALDVIFISRFWRPSSTGSRPTTFSQPALGQRILRAMVGNVEPETRASRLALLLVVRAPIPDPLKSDRAMIDLLNVCYALHPYEYPVNSLHVDTRECKRFVLSNEDSNGVALYLLHKAIRSADGVGDAGDYLSPDTKHDAERFLLTARLGELTPVDAGDAANFARERGAHYLRLLCNTIVAGGGGSRGEVLSSIAKNLRGESLYDVTTSVLAQHRNSIPVELSNVEKWADYQLEPSSIPDTVV